MTRFLARHELRAAFARSLSRMYGTEVPAYTTLVEVSTEVNADAMARDPERAQRLGAIDRVTAERHGAIRVGTAEELRQVAQLFAGLGMRPVGYYDLRGEDASSIPVVSTAFRPVEAEQLALNPFRVFTSCLVADDPRYFDADLTAALEGFLGRRQLFDPEVIALAARAEAEDGLPEQDATRFLAGATAAFELSAEPVDRQWYERLAAVSAVAADIGGVSSTHINHLTPRVLDIDDLYARMSARGITMIDEIQGPPRWQGPDVLLRQTSFKALAEPRRMREPDGRVHTGELRVRFGEVEARGVALTRAGRDLYDELIIDVDRRCADVPPSQRHEVKEQVWRERLPATELELAAQGLGWFRYRVAPTGTRSEWRSDDPADPQAGAELAGLLRDGTLIAEPIVYEDFLPRSAAGIFASNLDDAGHRDASVAGVDRGPDWLSEAMQRDLVDPLLLYGEQSRASLDAAAAELGIAPIPLTIEPSREARR